MEQVQIIARQHIKNPCTGELYNDQGLKMLNGYYKSEIKEDENSHDIDIVICEFEKLHPDFKADSYEIRKIKGCL